MQCLHYVNWVFVHFVAFSIVVLYTFDLYWSISCGVATVITKIMKTIVIPLTQRRLTIVKEQNISCGVSPQLAVKLFNLHLVSSPSSFTRRRSERLVSHRRTKQKNLYDAKDLLWLSINVTIRYMWVQKLYINSITSMATFHPHSNCNCLNLHWVLDTGYVY